MSAAVTRNVPVHDDPVEDFSHCHEGILSGLSVFAGLPELLEAARRAREVADHVLRLMDEAVLQHHAEEEQELFPAVLQSARPGAERERVRHLTAMLTDEHRDIEGLWKRLRPLVRDAALGRLAELHQAPVDLLVEVYEQHARMEERDFLPLAREILGRDGNHMAALGMSLHMRHVPLPIAHI
jgi:hemerythrin-like domain-containing protein